VCDDGLSVAVSTCPQPVVAYQRLVVAQSVLVDVAQARCTTDTDTHANIIIIIIIIIHEYYYAGAVALLLQDHLTLSVSRFAG